MLGKSDQTVDYLVKWGYINVLKITQGIPSQSHDLTTPQINPYHKSLLMAIMFSSTICHQSDWFAYKILGGTTDMRAGILDGSSIYLFN